MPKILVIKLASEQREELERIRDTDRRAYMRERATAILKISEGESGLQVARYGLLKPRDPDTVYAWVHRYEEDGVAGLRIKKGRGRKPSFFPPAS
jgi:transposase